MTTFPLAELPERFAFCDPASGKKLAIRSVRANSAIVVIGVDALGRIFVLDAWADRIPAQKLSDRMLETCERWQPALFGVEANAMQSLFADLVDFERRLRGMKIPITPIVQPTRIDKDFRIRMALQPVIGERRLFVHPSMVELIAEITTFPTNPKKDLVDALASAVAMVPPRSLLREEVARADALERYLLDTGLPKPYIERRMQDIALKSGAGWSG
jgi:phage terminase large subunit-like protein